MGPEFGGPRPGFHDPMFPPHQGPPPGFPGQVQQFDYGHQRRPGFEPPGPHGHPSGPPGHMGQPMSFDYDHGRAGGPPAAPPEARDPTIPMAPYHDLPAGLMVPLIKVIIRFSL